MLPIKSMLAKARHERIGDTSSSGQRFDMMSIVTSPKGILAAISHCELVNR